MARLIEGKPLKPEYLTISLNSIIKFYQDNALDNSKLSMLDSKRWHSEAIDPVSDRVVFKRYIEK
jgi:hypothetical protein